jgi:hypothetical protein
MGIGGKKVKAISASRKSSPVAMGNSRMAARSSKMEETGEADSGRYIYSRDDGLDQKKKSQWRYSAYYGYSDLRLPKNGKVAGELVAPA